MKRITIVTICILIALAQSYAQTKVEVKGNNNTYIVFNTGRIYSIWNKNNVLRNSDPIYLLNNEVIPPITVDNSGNLTPILSKYLVPYFQKYSGTIDSYDTLYLVFYSDMDGNIKEIKLMYPNKIGIIPGTVMESFECEILKSGVRLNFNKNNSVFRGSTYVTQYKAYSATKLKNGY